MLLDARDIPPQTQLDCDIVIVGAGAGGIPLAHEFLNSSLNVILLESGGFCFGSPTQDLFKGPGVSPPPHCPPGKNPRGRLRRPTTRWGGRSAPAVCLPFLRPAPL